MASFYIIYIIVPTQLKPDLAALPEPDTDDPSGGGKTVLFSAFLSIPTMGGSAVLLVRALFFIVTGSNEIIEGVEPILLGMVSDPPALVGDLAASLAAAYTLVGGPTFIANMIVGSEAPTMGAFWL